MEKVWYQDANSLELKALWVFAARLTGTSKGVTHNKMGLKWDGQANSGKWADAHLLSLRALQGYCYETEDVLSGYWFSSFWKPIAGEKLIFNVICKQDRYRGSEPGCMHAQLAKSLSLLRMTLKCFWQTVYPGLFWPNRDKCLVPERKPVYCHILWA